MHTSVNKASTHFTITQVKKYNFASHPKSAFTYPVLLPSPLSLRKWMLPQLL